jgi:hypothetical protein
MRHYRVWRYRVEQGVFTFSELKEWMLTTAINRQDEIISDYVDSIRRARFFHELNTIADCSEYCSITRID